MDSAYSSLLYIVIIIYIITIYYSEKDKPNSITNELSITPSIIKWFCLIFLIFGELAMAFSMNVGKENSDLQTGNTGHFAGGSINAYKLPCLVLFLMFSIGEDICPFDPAWNQKHLNDSKIVSTNLSVGKIILNALQSAFDVYLYNRSKILLESEIDLFKSILENSRKQALLLFGLRQDLNSKHRNKKWKRKPYSGFKLHGGLHFAESKKEIGTDSITSDTQAVENSHQSYKRKYEKTNKQSSNNSNEKQV